MDRRHLVDPAVLGTKPGQYLWSFKCEVALEGESVTPVVEMRNHDAVEAEEEDETIVADTGVVAAPAPAAQQPNVKDKGRNRKGEGGRGKGKRPMG